MDGQEVTSDVLARGIFSERGLKSAIQSAITFGGVNTDGEVKEHPRDFAAMLWRETFRLWSAVSAWGLDTPAFDAIHPLVAPWMETGSSADQPLDCVQCAFWIGNGLPFSG